MIKLLGQFFTRLSQKYLPDAYVFSLILTLVIGLLGILIQGKTPLEMINYWGDGFWNLMTFSMQMTLVLVAGFTLARTKLIDSLLNKISNLTHSNSSAVVVVTLVSIVACYINWGFGLIVSALIAVKVAKKVKTINYGLLVASAYSGFLVWHGGLSGSIPLKLTAPSMKIKNLLGVESISIDQTLYSNLNLIILFGTIGTILLLNYLMSRDTENISEFKVEIEEKKELEVLNDTFAHKIENSKVLNAVISLMGIIYIFQHFYQGLGMGLNIMIFIFLVLAITFHFTPRKFLFSFSESVKDSSGIILQFPFYAGIMGMMASSGLATSMSEFFVSISTPDTFLFFTYLSAGIVNFFVPSGGGQWAIQAPIILPAATELGVDLAKASMAIAWGDAWTNMVQPFWAIPLLTIGKVRLGDMMGHCVIIFLGVGAFSSLVFLFMA